MSARACVLSLNDVEELSELLDGQRGAVLSLLAEVDAVRNGMSLSEEVAIAALGELATITGMIAKTLDCRTRSESHGDG